MWRVVYYETGVISLSSERNVFVTPRTCVSYYLTPPRARARLRACIYVYLCMYVYTCLYVHIYNKSRHWILFNLPPQKGYASRGKGRSVTNARDIGCWLSNVRNGRSERSLRRILYSQQLYLYALHRIYVAKLLSFSLIFHFSVMEKGLFSTAAT
ncbi:hypothetical protein PUN28_009859 [Cardiocondyla obscurior]|uniref:Uncharacterized protein n=1 Tax=Cardiocondyla obscurior TaxID=286306 RepID=A0AAW2FQT4_9HYME